MNKLKGKLEINPNGSGYFFEEGTERKVYVYKKNTGFGLDGDIVEIDLIEGKSKGTKEGKVVNVIERNRTEFTGVLQKVKDFGFLVTDSKRIPYDFYMGKEQVKKYQIGEKLLVKLHKWKEGSNPTCKVIKSLGMVGDNDAEMETILFEYGLNPNFSDSVEKESEDIDWNISDEEISKRKDFRKITTFTIDPDTAKDFDDAISIKELGKNFYEIGVHIADVSHYVKKGSELDKEAQKRGNSVYLVDRVIPMIPERLSNGVCSLRPNEDKLTYSVIFEMDIDGKVRSKRIDRTIIHSDRRFTYEEAQERIESEDDNLDYSKEIKILNKISQNLRKKRNSLLFNRAEVKFELDHEFVPIGILTKESNESHQLIEELMLMANKVVGEKLSRMDTGIYRIHDEPNEEKLMELQSVCKMLGYDFHMNDPKKSLNKLSLEVKGTPYENMLSMLSIRSMSKAEYHVSPTGHYGLGFQYYTHFTSPIRRYSDLIAHRLLNKSEKKDSIDEVCSQINKCELNAKKAERSSIKFKQVEYLLNKVGQVFTGTITGITEWGIYVELTESKCEGLIRKNDIDGDIDVKNFKVKYNLGSLYLGDSITVIVKRVSLLEKEIDLKPF